jgi:hypothetical protein
MTLVPFYTAPFFLLCATLVMAQAPGRHPDLKYLRAPIPAGHSIDISAKPAQPLLRLQVPPEATYGSEDDPSDRTLGRIVAATLTPEGAIGLLDDQYTRLWVFDRSGHLIAHLGRAGQGPGEFLRLLSVAADRDGALYVGDISRSLKVFAPSQAGYHYIRTISLGVSAQAMCIMDSIIVINAPNYRQAGLFQTFTLAGQHLATFGEMYESPNPGINYQFNRGSLACDPTSHTFFFAAAGAFGEIRAYTISGNIRWRTTLTGFRSNLIYDRPGGYEVRRSEDGVHSILSLLFQPGVGVLAQVAWRSAKDLQDQAQFTALHTFLLNPADGTPHALGEGFPPLLAVGNGRGLAVWDDPVPHFSMQRLGAP